MTGINEKKKENVKYEKCMEKRKNFELCFLILREWKCFKYSKYIKFGDVFLRRMEFVI